MRRMLLYPTEQPLYTTHMDHTTKSMIDFDRSFTTWTGKPYELHPHYVNDGGMVQTAGSVRDVRIGYEATCSITNHNTGHVEELFLLHPCLGEFTIPKQDFFLLPSYEFRVIFTPTHQIPIDRPASVAQLQRTPQHHRFQGFKLRTRTFPQSSTLTTVEEVIKATLANRPLNVRTTYQDSDGYHTISLQYPARTVNVNVGESLFQVDTGPVPFSEMSGWEGKRPLFAFLSFITFSSFNSAEFILRREVEPSEEDKKWLHQIRGKWRWELRDPSNFPPGHPPRHPWPSVYNEVRVVPAHNEFLCADAAP